MNRGDLNRRKKLDVRVIKILYPESLLEDKTPQKGKREDCPIPEKPEPRGVKVKKSEESHEVNN
jgi:hypothetical protein